MPVLNQEILINPEFSHPCIKSMNLPPSQLVSIDNILNICVIRSYGKRFTLKVNRIENTIHLYQIEQS